MTGVLSPYGVSATDGIKLGAELINAAGGINGMPIKLIIDEEASDKNKALANVQKHIDYVVGNCKLPEEVGQQLHVVLEQILDGISEMKDPAQKQ